jgi:hypothetical protein
VIVNLQHVLCNLCQVCLDLPHFLLSTFLGIGEPFDPLLKFLNFSLHFWAGVVDVDSDGCANGLDDHMDWEGDVDSPTLVCKELL